jgi:proteasome assembly chaperone (PAC2) family protein
MDSGEVSTGTIKFLMKKLAVKRLAEIEGEGFYIQNFPGSMELAAIFRPYTKIEDGVIKVLRYATNGFFYDDKSEVILFLGKEPNMHWAEYADYIFSLCKELGVEDLYFIGSVAGLVPHTREPRIFSSVSDAKLKKKLVDYGVKFTNYEGPASIVTYMTANAGKRGLNMASLVATVPAYVQGSNPKCIESVVRHVASILELDMKLGEMRKISDAFEKKLSESVSKQPELEENIRKLEENYDNEVFDKEMGDLKDWLEQKGVRLD